MITSLYDIDFITPTGGTRRLLSVGDMLENEIAPKPSQRVNAFNSIGADWGETSTEGGAITSITWTVRKDYSSHAAMRSGMFAQAALFPTGENGVMRISISGGDVWEISNVGISAADPMPSLSGGFRTWTTYNATGGGLQLRSIIALYPGIPWTFINQNWESITTHWEGL